MNIDKSLKAAVTHLENSLEQAIESGEAECAIAQSSLRHFFTESIDEYGCGTYTRELTVPKGLVFVGKLHRHSHVAFLLEGEMLVVSATGKERIKAPHTWVSPVGAKRAFYALEKSILSTVHITKHLTTDEIDKVEDELIAPSYESMGLEEPDLSLILEKT
jgi:hypothetical protein